MQLIELNRSKKYFQDNPDKIKKFGGDVEQEYVGYDLAGKSHLNFKRYNERARKFNEKWTDKAGYETLLFSDLVFDENILVNNLFRTFDITGQSAHAFLSRENYYSQGHGEEEDLLKLQQLMLIDDTEEVHIFRTLINNKEAGMDLIEDKIVAAEFDKEDIIEDYYDPLTDFLVRHYDEWAKDCRAMVEVCLAIWKAKKKQKEADIHGFDRREYLAAIQNIRTFTKSNGNDIDKEFIPILQKALVKPAQLPRVVYRGMYLEKEMIESMALDGKLKVGFKPDLKMERATSWSASKDVAVKFMGRSHNYYDTGVLLEYEIKDLNVVIADLRNIEDDDYFYWGEQEIILSPEIKGYKIIQVMENKERHETIAGELKDYEDWKLIAGEKFFDFLRKFYFKIPELAVSPKVKEYAKKITTMTVKQVEEDLDLHTDRIDEKEKYMLWPMLAFVHQCNIYDIYNVTAAEIETRDYVVSLGKVYPNNFKFLVHKFKHEEQKDSFEHFADMYLHKKFKNVQVEIRD